MTGWCVEYWRVPKRYGGSHAQMSEQLKYTRPEQEDIQRRYLIDMNQPHVLQTHYLTAVIILLKL